MKAPMEDFLATVLPRTADTGSIRGKLPPKSFLLPPNFLFSEKSVLNVQKQKSFPLKMYLVPKTLKPDWGPSSAKIVSAIRIVCFEGHSA